MKITTLHRRAGGPAPTAFVSIVHPGVAPYFRAFLESVARQTNQEFHLYLFNDGWADCSSIVEQIGGPPTTIVEFGCSTAENRPKAIEFLCDRGHKAVVFGDSDDCFAEDRIEHVTKRLNEREIVVNDLSLIDVGGSPLTPRYLSHRLTDGAKIRFNDLRDSNLCGLSNTAIRAELLPLMISFGPPGDVIAVDWFWFCSLLFHGCGCMFTTSAISYYRQYEQNTAGFSAVTPERVRRGVEVKLRHYRRMSRLVPEFVEKAERFAALSQRMTEDPEFTKRYIGRLVASTPAFPLWWEEILDTDEG